MALLYHSEDDLLEVRPNILNYGESDFEAQLTQSETEVNRALDTRWYRNVAVEYSVNFRSTPFDPSKVSAAQVKRACVYKSLELIYMYLMKEKSEPDAFQQQSSFFADKYRVELKEILNGGIDYDWDDDDTIASDEKASIRIRRLVRV